MDDPLALSLLEYIGGHDITSILHMSLDDIDDLYYFDTSSVKQNISSTYKIHIRRLQCFMRHKQIYYDWSSVTPEMFDSVGE